MKNIIKLVLVLSFGVFAACSTAGTGNTTNTANTNTANTANAANAPAGTDTKVTGSPTETLKALNEGSKAKNPEAIKKTLSKGTLLLIEESAKNQKKSVDELLKEDDGAPFKELPELGKEEVTGDTAILEVKNKVTGEWEKIPFIVENGEWKVALDKYLEELEKRFAEDQKKEPPTK